MKTFLTAWIVSVISAICLTINPAFSQDLDIKLQFRGDTIHLDTAVVMDLSSYRNIRQRLALLQARDSLGVEINGTNEAIIMQIEARNEQLIQVIDELYVMLNRRQEVIDTLSNSISRLEAINEKSLDSFENYVNNEKKFWQKPTTWGALAVGFIVGALISN